MENPDQIVQHDVPATEASAFVRSKARGRKIFILDFELTSSNPGNVWPLREMVTLTTKSALIFVGRIADFATRRDPNATIKIEISKQCMFIG